MNLYYALAQDISGKKKKIKQKLWSRLPKDILHIILCYHGTMVDRNGRLVGRIPKYDTRYMVIDNIPRIEIVCDDSLIMKVCFSNKKMEMYTPLNIINRTPKGHPVQCSRATLPENQLYQAHIKDGRPDSNVHRCKYVHDVAYFGNFADFYNFETDTLVCRGFCIDGDVYMFQTHINPFCWFRQWMYRFPYQQ